ncbi:SIR2 family protein [Fictibacillus sp. 7GRE50]|uniref:SIR2 family NAD-dependent protein deacylase n=1 Tax=Fictibacillus sp. 7GRE50 TaxID=2745878 RepID=UPI0018CD4951|nr:SIR2 family protein [Fictibacillus sp. 7GRE50]MBH0167607.1 SIR2 family protein [Fictibacillus sp. 7GRE50]
MDGNLEQLRDAYHDNKVVPFIGAGLSVPFKIPTWGDLIRAITDKYAKDNIEVMLRSVVDWHLESNDYWGAIDEIKKYARLADQDIQKMIVTLIKRNKEHVKDDNLHNYSDLAKMKFKLHLTTNYENLLYEHLKSDEVPILLKELDFSTQDMFDEKRICHLHGYTANPGSIVISRSSYEALYSNEKYGELLKAVTSSKNLLFMGFSFDDKFVSNLIKDYKQYLNGIHYILLANPTNSRMRELREDYGLITIPYETEGSTHVAQIRKILNQIAEPQVEDKINGFPNGSDGTPMGSASSVVLGAGLAHFKKNVKGNLFYKKLKLENIDESIIELSSIFYVASEEYMRALKQAGMSLDVIGAILGKVFTKYKERYVDTYKIYGNSEQFLTVIHESLEEFDFGRYAVLFEDNKSDENENRGLIHLLAEDETMDVWWGKERFNEQPDQ